MSNQVQSIFLQSHGAKLSTRKMPRSQADWGAFIMNELLKQHPSLSGKGMDVDYQNIDESQGYALGSVSVKDEDKRNVMNIPFIVEANELHPLDVFFKKGDDEPRYLTEDRIREVMFKERMSNGLAPTIFNGSITDDGYDTGTPYSDYSAIQGPYTKHASALSGMRSAIDDGRFSVTNSVLRAYDYAPSTECLSEIVKHAASERFSAFDAECAGVDGSLRVEDMRLNGTLFALQKIAEQQSHAITEDMIKSAASGPVYSINSAHIVKRGPDVYDAYVTRDAPRSERFIKMAGIGYGMCSNMIESMDGDPNHEMQMIERSGERIISNVRPVDKSTHLIEELMPERWQTLDEQDGKVNVFSSGNSSSYSGHAFGRIESLTGKSLKSKLFIKPDGPYAYQSSIAVEYLEGGLKDKNVGKLVETAPHAGISATLLYAGEDDNDTIATEPFEITSVEKGRLARTLVKVVSESGIEYNLMMSSHVKSPTLHRKKKNRDHGEYVPREFDSIENLILVPRESVMVKLNYRIDLSSRPKEALSDSKLTRSSQYPLKVKSAGEGKLSVKSASFRAEDVWAAWKLNSLELEKSAAFHLLVSQGVPPQKADFAIKKAELAGHAELHVPENRYQPVLQQKVASAQFDAIRRELIPLQRELGKVNLVKIASTIPGPATVANILSIRMIGPETFRYFVSSLPLLEKTLSFLGTLILTSRLDSTLNLEQSDLATAMSSIDNVINHIKNMRSMSLPS